MRLLRGRALALPHPPAHALELWLVTLGDAARRRDPDHGTSAPDRGRPCAASPSAARTDVLTGLLNRRGFEEAFELELERARRGGHTLSVLVGDLDNFKQINDRFGHHAGDLALARASDVLERRKRRIDTVARLGGEEFALLVPGRRRPRRLHAGRAPADAHCAKSSRRGPVPLTISFGVASFPPHGDSLRGPAAAPPTTRSTRRRSWAATAPSSTAARSPASCTPSTARRAAQRAPRDRAGARRGARHPRRRAPRATRRRVGRYAALIARELGLPDDARRARPPRRHAARHRQDRASRTCC